MHRLSPICVSRSNSLIFNFANKKNEYGKKYIQSAVLRERQQGERRYCPQHGTSDNQRYCGAVQLQADHPENPLGCERQPSQRQECRSTERQSGIGFSILLCSASIKRTLFSFAKVVFFSFIAKVIPLKNRVNQTSYHYCTFVAHLADENQSYCFAFNSIPFPHYI